MSGVQLDDACVAPVAEFISSSVSRELSDGRDGWNDKAMTAWQFGCMALVALGYAKPEKWGASRLPEPQNPKTLPRWDDICVVVLNLLSQMRAIQYRQADGHPYQVPLKPGQLQIKPIYPTAEEPVIPAPNIAAGHNCLPAYVGHSRLSLLETLGLVRDGAWTREAELVLWRIQPSHWRMNLIGDPRYVQGQNRCLATMPDSVQETLRELAKIDAAMVDAGIKRQKKANADLIKKYPAQAKFDRTIKRERIFKTLVSVAKHHMDQLFFANWRLLNGWLPKEQKKTALSLFHDPLAIMMRDSVLRDLGVAFPTEVPT